jgi:hypothetical protein
VTDFLRLIVEVVQFLWPFRIVWQWERGAYYVCGHFAFNVGVGCWPVIPFFFDVKAVPVVPDVIRTSEQTIELRDGSTLTFQAVARCHVTDVNLALNNVVDYENNLVDDVEGSLADTLADLPPERFGPEKRTAMLRLCALEITKLSSLYGVECESVRFNNFIRQVRVFRLLGNLQGAT